MSKQPKTTLNKEFDYFINNLDELVKTYKNKYIVIKGEEILGAYKSLDQALIETLKTEEAGTFLVQQCKKSVDTYTHTFHNRVLVI